MPRFFEPEADTYGPLGTKKKKSIARRSRKKDRGSGARSMSAPPVASFDKAPESPAESPNGQPRRLKSYIGQDLLESVPAKDAPAVPKTSPKGKNSGSTAQGKSKKTSEPSASGVVTKSHDQPSRGEHMTAQVLAPEVLGVTNNISKYLSLSRRALALDTRWLATNENGSNSSTTTANHVVNYMQDFIRTLELRGAKPCLVASTENDTRGKYGMTVNTCSVGRTTQSNILSPIFVQAKPVGTENDDSAAVSIPNGLTAEHSWELLGGMVKKLHAEGSGKSKTTKSHTPMTVIIVTTDVALFCDTKVAAHANAVDRFAETIAPLALDAVQIIVATTSSLGLLTQAADGAKDGSIDGSASEKQGETESEGVPDPLQKHQDAMNHCIDAIQAKLDELDCAVTSRHGVGAEPVGVATLSFTVIDCNPLGFRFLSRQWVRETLLDCATGRLQFDLPELDGTQCSVSLETSYQIFPFAVDSPQASMLLDDLCGMGQTKMEVCQLVPLSSIDASLLFGIPMTVRAGLGNGYGEFRETNALVRSMFKLLQERTLALLLRAPASNAKSTKGLFSSVSFSSTEQLYVLMAQEPPASLGESPCSGLLFRFAQADHLLDVNVGSTGGLGLLGRDEELEAQYAECIDAAFTTLECSPFNPLTSSAYYDSAETVGQKTVETFSGDTALVELSASSAHTDEQLFGREGVEQMKLIDQEGDTMSTESRHSLQKESISSVWNDASGVGACAPPLFSSQDDDAHMEDNDYHEMETSPFFD